ncbi:DUF4333 domain-containing protein [Deinococcus saxicola]|uniref:hypothetical protein n=1 Tax=Deinococcus saxicola TaxID=249406 RepID=UPI0039F12A1A
MIWSVRRLWPALGLIVLLLGALWAVPAVRQAGAERQRQTIEAERQAGAQRLMTSDPVRFEEYVRQVALAADVIGDGEQDASGPCLSVSGFESGVGDPPPETASCVIRDPGEGPATVKLTLRDGRIFLWPRE